MTSQPPHDLGYASATDLAAHWKIDRRTVPSVLKKFEVSRSALHNSPRYKWSDILLKVDRVPAEFLREAPEKILQPLLTTFEVADILDVSVQTVRNYIAAGRLRAVVLLARTPRFHQFNNGL
jgi:excisionase family DNA binding protein